MPGIRREKTGSGFRYRYPTGELVREEPVLRRIKSLAIPPAWSDVWICPDPVGHLQATGRDLRRRKQSRYHPKWREVRDETKYSRMVEFGKALPKIREVVEKDLAAPALSQRKVLATLVRLLETTLIRIGNQEYARENKSFGLTTLRDKHVKIKGDHLQFHFRGKSGKWHFIELQDRRMARIVKHCQDLPGQELFQYQDDEGNCQGIKSDDVNAYLRDATGQEFTAKDFRTWAGTVMAALALRELQQFVSQAQAKKHILQAIEAVSQRLGNTVSVCRKCYVHPDVLGAYMDGSLIKTLKTRAEQELSKSLSRLSPEEAAVLALLQQRLNKEDQTLEALRRSVSRAKAKRISR